MYSIADVWSVPWATLVNESRVCIQLIYIEEMTGYAIISIGILLKNNVMIKNRLYFDFSKNKKCL